MVSQETILPKKETILQSVIIPVFKKTKAVSMETIYFENETTCPNRKIPICGSNDMKNKKILWLYILSAQ